MKYIYYIVLTLLALNNNLLFANILNVKDFGAKGDGRFDDTRAIQEAINHGARRGETIMFPHGTYLVSSLKINTSIEGDGNVVLKRIRSKGNGHYDFCTIGKQEDISIRGITFDANSPKGVSSKGIPLFVFSSRDIDIENCEFLNSSMSGLRIESASNISINRSIARNSSGNYGDGFYFTKSHHIKIENSSAMNYTRIGFVVEDNSSEINFDNCRASFGTGASILSGGTEFNGGFWYENSANVYTKNCVASNNTHRGFVAANAKKEGGIAKFTFDNCISEDNPIGFSLSSKGGVSVNIRVTNSKAINVERGFVASARHLSDKFEFENCEVHLKKISAGALNNVGFMWESPITKENKRYKSLPTFSYSNSKIVYDKAEELNAVRNSKANNGDISTYSGGKARVIIRGMTNSLTGDKLILKARRGNPQYVYD